MSATKGGEKTGTLVALGEAPAARGGDLLSHDELGRVFGHLVSRVSLRKNKDVIVAGARYDVFYLAQQGWLIRYKILHDGRRQILDFVLPGEVFGLQSCLFKTSLYSVSTITDAMVSAIRVGAIDATFDASNPTPKLAKALFWAALSEAAVLGEHLVDAARRSAYQRVGHLLLELFVRLKRGGMTDGASYRTPLTQELIADALGLTPVHVNRTLSALRRDNLAAVEGRHVEILNFEALALASDFENSYHGGAFRDRIASVKPIISETGTPLPNGRGAGVRDPKG